MTIGTHTAKISITNVGGEKAEKEWSFTVGIRDVPTPPLPAGSRIIKEISVDPSVVLPGCKIAANLSVVVYQDSEGRRYSEYKLTSPTGSFVSSRNPAFIARRMNSNDTMKNDRLTVLPRISHAFIGNNITFNYGYSGPGTIESVSWDINSNGVAFTEPSIIIHGNTVVKCTVSGKIQTGSGENDHYSFVEKSQRIIRILTLRTEIYSYRQSIIGSIKPHTFDLEGRVYTGQYPFELSEGANFPAGNETDAVPGTLRVNRLRWKIIATDCHPKIEDETATATSIVFSDHGFAEVVFEVDLTYSQDGRDLKGTFAPQSSALYAFYPVEGKAELEKSYTGQLVNTRRSLTFKRIDFKIKGQQRIIQNEAECNLQSPVILCESVLWPASSPLEIKSVLPIIATENPGKDEDDDSEDDEDDGDDINNPILEYISRFNFHTRPWPEPCQKQLSCYAMFLPWALPDDSEKSIEAEYGIPLISQLPPITVFKAEDVLESKLEPSQPQTIPEGMEVEFKAALTPRPDLGEGILSKESQDTAKFDVLDGYKIKALPDIEWLEDPDWIDNTNWNSSPVAAAFSHIFKPTHGIGSYTLRCRFNFELEESETKDSSKVVIENEVPVSAIPGLRLLSPINKLVYPLDQTIKVTTTMDSQDEWEDITWQLNGEKFDPPGEDPGFPLLLDKAGKWSIEARLETINPNTGKLIPLISSATFEVKPLNIAITPAKQVSKFVQGLKLPIEVVAKFDNSIVEAPGKEFYWADKTKAIIDPVQWAAVSVPENCADLDSDPQSFKAECDFNAAGAATVLATVTLRIVGAEELFKKAHKGFKDKFEEQVFEFPVTRADLWAVKLGAITNEEKHFPEKSIAKAYRTYEVKSFAFDFESGSRSKKPQTYTAKDGLDEPISLKPALSGIDQLSASINFKWQVTSDKEIEQKLVEPTKMVIKPTEVCDYKVAAEANLDFGCSALKLGEISVSANAVDLFTLIETKVYPASFTITIGDSKTLRYIISSLENNPSPTDTNPDPVNTLGDESGTGVIYLLNNSYALAIDNVEWSDNQGSQQPPTPAKNSIEGNPYTFFAKLLGNVNGQANGLLKLSEVLSSENNKTGQSSGFHSVAFWNTRIVLPTLQILVNGKMIGSDKLYLGQEIILSAKVFNHEGETLNYHLKDFAWEIEKPIFQSFYMLPDQSEGGIAELQDLNTNSICFYMFDYDQEKVSKKIQLACNCNLPSMPGTKLKSGVQTLNYARPIIENPSGSPQIPIASQTLAGDWYLGYNKANYIGLKLTHSVQNQTDIPYVFRCYQLIKIDCSRIIASSSEIERLATDDAFWLDEANPYTDKSVTVPAKQNLPFSVFVDSPYVFLDSSLKEVNELSANFEFRVILMGAPVKEGQNASWVPLGQLTHWGWSGHIKKDSNGIWGWPETMADSCDFFLLSNDNLGWLRKTVEDVIPTWVSEGR